MTKKERIVSISALVFLLVSAIALAIVLLSNHKPKSKTLYGYFGTADTCTIICYANDSESVFNKRCAEVEDLVQKYHKLTDIYHEYEGINNLKTLNDAAGGKPVKIEKELMEMLVYAKKSTISQRATSILLWVRCSP